VLQEDAQDKLVRYNNKCRIFPENMRNERHVEMHKEEERSCEAHSEVRKNKKDVTRRNDSREMMRRKTSA
jgi:hypothetical protein